MTKPLRVEAEAEADLWSAADWYDAEQPGLGDELLAAVRDKLDEVQEHPQAAPLLPDPPEGAPVRQGRVRRFPYLVVYLDLPGEVWVVAFAHLRRDPGYWHKRVSP